VLSDLNVAPIVNDDRLRFVNASPNSNPVNAAVSGTQVASNIAYGTASAYVEVPTATVTITFSDATTGAVLATQSNVVLTANQTVSVYLIGPPGAQGIIVTQDN
jgi:hypothetical protein